MLVVLRVYFGIIKREGQAGINAYDLSLRVVTIFAPAATAARATSAL